MKYIPEDDCRHKLFYEAYLVRPTTVAEGNDIILTHFNAVC